VSVMRRHGVSDIGDDASGLDSDTSATVFVTDGLSFTPTGQVSCDFARYFDAVRVAASRFPRARIRHPVVAHELLGLRYPRSAALFGFPGSGNTVFMAVAEQLQRLAQYRLGRDQEFFQALAGSHVEFMIFALQQIAPALGQWALIPSNQRLGVMDIGCVSESGEADHVGRLRRGLRGRLFSLPTLNHAALCFVSHGFDEAGLQRLDDHDFTCFLVVRNPLDTIHSLVSKYDTSLAPIVQDYEAFDLLVQGMVTYLNRVDQCAGRHSILKYETLLAEFETQAATLTEKLGLECDAGLFGQLKTELLFRNLVGDPIHFRGGRSGRWKAVLDRRHYDVLRRRGMFDVMRALGYAPPGPDEFRAEPVGGEVSSSLGWDLYFFHHLVDVPLPSAPDPAYGTVAGTGSAFHIDDPSVRRQLATELQTPFGRVLLALAQ
jgi:hypothetical protein